MTKLLPDALYITLLRNPVTCYESNYVYMGLEKAFKMDINQFAKVEAREHVTRRPTAIIGKNQMLWDLGMSHTDMEDKVKVSKKISELDKEFHFVLIAEHFDESLVLLAWMMCWDLRDVTYLKQNARKASKISNITTSTQKYLESWLQADYQLYDHFLAKYESLADKYDNTESE